jgi:hypothetical protein
MGWESEKNKCVGNFGNVGSRAGIGFCWISGMFVALLYKKLQRCVGVGVSG